MAFDRRLFNVVFLGFGFMLVFTAFQTMGNIQKTVLDSIQKDDENFTGDGYTSLAVIYAVFAICNWMAPSIISVIGPRLAMVIGSATYALFIVSFLLPMTWLMYFASAVLGFGAAIIWTGQGNYLTLNSDASTISKNAGIFWAMLQLSMFSGNLFVFIVFQSKTHIEYQTRALVFVVLGAVCGSGVVVLVLLRPAERADGQQVVKEEGGPLAALRTSLSMLLTKEMLLLSVTIFYSGIELSFYSGVYSSSVGFTRQMGNDTKKLVGMSGIFIGVGEVVGGALFGIMGHKLVLWGRDPIVMIGFLTHIFAFFFVFINLPDSAPFKDTDEKAFIKSNRYLAMLCSLMLGLGDSCYNTQIYSILGSVWSENSAPAFALFKFTQSLAAAASFFYSSSVGLYAQIYILVTLAIVGTTCFTVVEIKTRGKTLKVKDFAARAPDD